MPFQTGDRVTVRLENQNCDWYRLHDIRHGDPATVLSSQFIDAIRIKYDKLDRAYHLTASRHQLLEASPLAGIRHRTRLAEQRGHLVTE